MKLRITEISKYPLVPLEKVVDILDHRRKPVSGLVRAGMQGSIPYFGANGLLDHINQHLFDEELVLVAEDGGFFDDPHRPISYRVSGKCWINNHAHVLRPLANIDIDWLNYSIAYQDVGEFVNGAVLPKLTQRDLRRLPIPLPDLRVQRRVVTRIKDCLSRVEEMQRLREEMETEIAVLEIAWLRQRFAELANEWPQEELAKLADIKGGGSLPKGTPATAQPNDWLLVKVGDMNLPGNELEITTAREYLQAGDTDEAWPIGTIVFPKRGGAIATNKKRLLGRPALLDPNLMGERGGMARQAVVPRARGKPR